MSVKGSFQPDGNQNGGDQSGRKGPVVSFLSKDGITLLFRALMLVMAAFISAVLWFGDRELTARDKKVSDLNDVQVKMASTLAATATILAGVQQTVAQTVKQQEELQED